MAGPYIADRRLYLDKDGKVVEEGDPTKESLLVGIGGILPEARARELGLIQDEKAKEPSPNKAKVAVAANKARESPVENREAAALPANEPSTFLDEQGSAPAFEGSVNDEAPTRRRRG